MHASSAQIAPIFSRRADKVSSSSDDQLAQQVYLSGIRGPKSYDLEFLRRWFERPKMGNFPLRGPDRHAWSAQNAHDLLAIKRRESRDPFSRWLTDTFIPWFHNCVGNRFKKPLPEDPESGICEYCESHLSAAVDVLGTAIASMLPVSSILIL